MPRTFPPNTDSPRHVGSGFYRLGDLRSFLALSGAPGDANHALPCLKSALNAVPHGAGFDVCAHMRSQQE